MRDPAIEAAQRAWDAANVSGMKKPWAELSDDNTFVKLQIASAREMATPIRELHRKSPIHNLAEDCEICSDDDEQVQAQHAPVMESEYGDYLCAATVVGYTCAHCAELRAADQDLPEWPCVTATYLYSADELGFDK